MIVFVAGCPPREISAALSPARAVSTSLGQSGTDLRLLPLHSGTREVLNPGRRITQTLVCLKALVLMDPRCGLGQAPAPIPVWPPGRPHCGPVRLRLTGSSVRTAEQPEPRGPAAPIETAPTRAHIDAKLRLFGGMQHRPPQRFSVSPEAHLRGWAGNLAFRGRI